MERTSSFRDSGPERNVKFTITHMLVSRVGVFVLCAIMSTLSCKSNTRNNEERPSVTQSAEESSEERANRRRDEREEDRNLIGFDRR